jgi:flagellar motor switch protein FliN/FliY
MADGQEFREDKEELGINLDFILDIPLLVTVELGRARMPIQDLLKIGEGSVMELNKLVGEPLDVLVNGKAVARGEVVVVNAKFALRLTDIAQPNERLNQLR